MAQRAVEASHSGIPPRHRAAASSIGAPHKEETSMRPSGRSFNEMREVSFETGVNRYAEGS